MLGEKIGEESGKVTARRVMRSEAGGVKMETSFEGKGMLLGVAEQGTGTYWAVMRPDGTLYGEGQGLAMGAGGEVATWVGQGVGTIKKDGAVSYRGALYYQSPAPKWARLNGIAVVFEYEVDAQGNTRSQLHEWK